MKKRVQIFEVQADGSAKPGRTFEVEGGTTDALTKAARDRIKGGMVRSVSHGPDQINLYVVRS
jgi:hypothetical protein